MKFAPGAKSGAKSKPAGFAVVVLLLTGCHHSDPMLHGYIESEPVRVASPIGGKLLQLSVERGSQVKQGQPLFVLEQTSEQAAVAEAQARLAQAEATASATPSTAPATSRSASVIEEQLVAARATASLSAADLQRQNSLARSGFVSPATLQSFRTRHEADTARVQELEAQLRAARAGTQAAAAQVTQRQWSLEQKAVSAPVSAQVEDTYYRVGEWVPPGSPVLSLLAPQGVKVRFWVPEGALSKLPPGSKVTVHCDGCEHDIPAVVRFIDRTAEFTPPVIYSKESRAKLVFMAEAEPSAQDKAKLRPGQPVDVSLP